MLIPVNYLYGAHNDRDEVIHDKAYIPIPEIPLADLSVAVDVCMAADKPLYRVYYHEASATFFRRIAVQALPGCTTDEFIVANVTGLGTENVLSRARIIRMAAAHLGKEVQAEPTRLPAFSRIEKEQHLTTLRDAAQYFALSDGILLMALHEPTLTLEPPDKNLAKQDRFARMTIQLLPKRTPASSTRIADIKEGSLSFPYDAYDAAVANATKKGWGTPKWPWRLANVDGRFTSFKRPENTTRRLEKLLVPTPAMPSP